jgi:AcrR family transcriptional regulator
MAEYSTSQKTKKALIMAAGELFAENEINVVGLRDIALKAGENMGSIHYHFGGKKGLLKAVIDYAWEPALNDTLGKYFQSHETLLDTREGQALLVAEMIDFYFKTIFNDRPLWCGILISRILDRKMPFSENIIENNIRFFLEPFFLLYKKT